MAKIRRPREALGVVVRQDGVRVEVKNPTIYRQLTSQQELIQSMRSALGTMEAERDAAKLEAARRRAAFDAIAGSWWVSLGARLRFVRLRQIEAAPEVSQGARALSPRNESAIPAT